MDVTYVSSPWFQYMDATTAAPPAPVQDQGPPPPSGSDSLELLHTLMWYMQMYYNPAAAILGITSNIIAFIVIPFSDLYKISLGHYILAILVSNTGFLVNVLLLWMNHMGIQIYRHGSVCHFTTFISYASCFLSVWYTVCLAVDGFIVVGFRFQADRMCQPSRARIVIFCLAAVATAVFLNISLTYGVIDVGTTYICTAVSQFQEPLQTLKYIDVFANSMLPYTAIIYILIHTIIAHLCHPADTRRPLKRTRHATESVQFPLGLYILFILVCLVIDIPSQASMIYFTVRDLALGKSYLHMEWEYLWQQVMNNVQNIKYAVLFFILLCSAQFRVGFQRIPAAVCRKRQLKTEKRDNGLSEDNNVDDTSTSLIEASQKATASV